MSAAAHAARPARRSRASNAPAGTARGGRADRDWAVIDSLAEGVVIHDAAGRIVDSNPAARRLLGLEVDELTGRTAFDPSWRAVWPDATPASGRDHPSTIARTTGQRVSGVVMGIRQASGAAGEASMLRQVWVNLLGNALKFTRTVDLARIEVRSEQVDGERRYTVRDNGIGFDPVYAGKLFQPFQRLHSSSDYEGTGIGLAIVARIIARHGGRVWADAVPGPGATFGFALREEIDAP